MHAGTAIGALVLYAVIRVVSVKSDLKGDNIGYARVTTFTENTSAELANAIIRLKDRAQGRLNGLILDLRNDPGGLLDAAVEVAGEFIDGGVVVTTRGRNGADDHIYHAPATGDLADREGAGHLGKETSYRP